MYICIYMYIYVQIKSQCILVSNEKYWNTLSYLQSMYISKTAL